MDLKYIAVRGSKGKEKHIFQNWRKGSPCYTVTENVVKLTPEVI